MAKRGENLYKRKDGRWEGRYIKSRRPDGKAVFGYIYGKNYQEVRTRLLLKKAEHLSAAARPSDHGFRLSVWMEQWLREEIALRIKPSSLQTYYNLFYKHIEPGLGHVRLGALSREIIQAFMDSLVRKKMAVNTLKGVGNLLSSALKGAVEQGLLTRTPYQKIRIQRAPAPEQRTLTVDEQRSLRTIASAAKQIPALLGLYCGMRLGEICALKWSDIDWQNKTITVNRTVQRVRTAPQGQARSVLMIGTPKSLRSRRVIPVPSFILDYLADLAARPVKGEFLFGVTAPAEPRTIQRRFQRTARAAGVSNVHFHTLRHTFATRLLEIGVDVKTVSVLLGHASARVTLDFYAHSLLENQRKAVCALAAS